MALRRNSSSSDERHPPPSPRVANLLRCNNCDNYMVDRIARCVNSHQTCCSAYNRCVICSEPLLPPNKTTWALEHLAAYTEQLPCRNLGFGCAVGLPARQMVIHELNCHYKQYQCLVDYPKCQWHGRRTQLQKHTAEKHPSLIVHVPNTTNWQVSKNGCFVDLVRHLIYTSDELFLYQKRFDYNTKHLFVAIQLIGPPARSQQFQYKFKLTRQNGSHSVSFKHLVHDENEDLISAFALGDCIKVPYDIITQFSSGSRTVSICKTKKYDSK